MLRMMAVVTSGRQGANKGYREMPARFVGMFWRVTGLCVIRAIKIVLVELHSGRIGISEAE